MGISKLNHKCSEKTMHCMASKDLKFIILSCLFPNNWKKQTYTNNPVGFTYTNLNFVFDSQENWSGIVFDDNFVHYNYKLSSCHFPLLSYFHCRFDCNPK